MPIFLSGWDSYKTPGVAERHGRVLTLRLNQSGHESYVWLQTPKLDSLSKLHSGTQFYVPFFLLIWGPFQQWTQALRFLSNFLANLVGCFNASTHGFSSAYVLTYLRLSGLLWQNMSLRRLSKWCFRSRWCQNSNQIGCIPRHVY